MSGSPIYHSKFATITTSLVEINGHAFDAADIDEVSTYDESEKARRWAKFGFIGGAAATALNLIPGVVAGPGPLFAIPMLLGGGALLLFKLKPAFGTGLVVTLKDGSASIIRGIPRAELVNLISGIKRISPPQA
jgi:hypothetical protein